MPFVIAAGPAPNPTDKEALKCEHKESICTCPPSFPLPEERASLARHDLGPGSRGSVLRGAGWPDYRSTVPARELKNEGVWNNGRRESYAPVRPWENSFATRVLSSAVFLSPEISPIPESISVIYGGKSTRAARSLRDIPGTPRKLIVRGSSFVSGESV